MRRFVRRPAAAGVATDGDYVIVGAGVALPGSQRPLIIACKLGATGKAARHRELVAARRGLPFAVLLRRALRPAIMRR